MVNFTVPFELPDGGTGMDLEDNRPGTPGPGGGEAITVPYRTGTMLFTESEYWHRIGGSRCREPNQRRTTLQGHGVRIDDHWVLFWGPVRELAPKPAGRSCPEWMVLEGRDLVNVVAAP